MFFLKLLVLFFFLAWFPGYFLTSLFRIPLRDCRTALLFLPFAFGIPFTSVVYFVARMFHLERYLLFLPIASLLACTVMWWRAGRPFLSLRFSSADRRDFFIFLALFLVVLGFFASFALRNYYDQQGGLVIGDGAYDDSIWSVSVSAELKHHVPPRLPLLAGYRLRYHYLGDLFTELLYRMSRSRMTMLEFDFKYEPPFFLLLLMGTIYFSLRSCFRSSLVVFGTIGLFVFAPLRTPLFFKHHETLALIYFYVATFYLLNKYYRSEKRPTGYLVGAFFLIAFLPLHDAVFGVVTNGTLFLYALVDSFRARRMTPFLIASLASLAFGSTLYIVALGWPQHHVASFVFGKGPQMASARRYFKPYTIVLKYLLNLIPGAQTFAGHLFFECVMGIYHTVFLILFFALPESSSLQYNILSIPLCLAVLLHPKRYERIWSIGMGVVAACILFPLFVTYKRGPAETVTLRALEFAAALLIPFTVLVIRFLWTRRGLFGKIVLAILLVYYVFPGYRHNSFYLKPFYYSYIDKDTLEILNFLRNKTPVSSVVLHPFHNNPIYKIGEPPNQPAWIFEGHYFFVSALGERQVVFEGAASSTTYYMGDASSEEVFQRVRQVDQFYESLDRTGAEAFLDRFHVNYVWVPRKKTLPFDMRGLLTPVLENPRHILFKVEHPLVETS